MKPFLARVKYTIGGCIAVVLFFAAVAVAQAVEQLK